MLWSEILIDKLERCETLKVRQAPTNLEPSFFSEALSHLIASLTANPMHVCTRHFIFFLLVMESQCASGAKQSGNSQDQRLNTTRSWHQPWCKVAEAATDQTVVKYSRYIHLGFLVLLTKQCISILFGVYLFLMTFCTGDSLQVCFFFHSLSFYDKSTSAKAPLEWRLRQHCLELFWWGYSVTFNAVSPCPFGLTPVVQNR